MINVSDKSLCCGCGACADICPAGAISMKADELGFLYPQVNPDACTGCGECERVCSFAGKLPAVDPQAFKARNKDAAELAASISGGIFPALSDAVLSCGGAVYGAGWKDHFTVVHKRALTKEERDEFRRSKYVQSYAGDCFPKIREDLREGRKVLFSGTPCQVAAVKMLTGNPDNLLLVEIVCHAVPAPGIWKAYLELLERKAGSKAVKVEFRDKARFGWRVHKGSVEFENGKVITGRSFADLFYKHLSIRPSCEKCPFACTERGADVSLADFWGYKGDDLGLSMVLVSTEKGRNALQAVSGSLDLEEVELKDHLQRPLREPAEANQAREEFTEYFLSEGMEKTLRKYGDWNIKSQIHYLYKHIRKKARKILLNRV